MCRRKGTTAVVPSSCIIWLQNRCCKLRLKLGECISVQENHLVFSCTWRQTAITWWAAWFFVAEGAPFNESARLPSRVAIGARHVITVEATMYSKTQKRNRIIKCHLNFSMELTRWTDSVDYSLKDHYYRQLNYVSIIKFYGQCSILVSFNRSKFPSEILINEVLILVR